MKKTLTFIGLLLASLSAANAQVIISNFSTYTENFNGMGNSTTATLPTGFKVLGGASPTWSSANATTATTLAYGSTGTGAVTGTSSGGIINWGNGTTATATDRSLGVLNTGSFTSPQNIMFSLTNNTLTTLTSLNISWDYEKFRSGSRAWNWTFFSSTDGSTWTSQTAGDLAYAADANNTTVLNPPTTTSSPSFSISGLSIANGSSFYLRWTLTGVGGSSNGQGLAIDNFALTAIPEPSTWMLIGLGLTFILARFRRNRIVA